MARPPGYISVKVEYDATRDLLYVWFAAAGSKAARTETITPGIHADFDREGRLVGIEVLDARATLGDDLKIEFALAAAS